MNRCPLEAFRVIDPMTSMPHIEKGQGGAIMRLPSGFLREEMLKVYDFELIDHFHY